MPNVTFVDCEGVSRSVTAEVGATLMETARSHDIPGIDADCGGVCACATCHVYVDEEYLRLLPPVGQTEGPMLEFVIAARHNSRLACQLPITTDLDGLKVTTPASQR